MSARRHCLSLCAASLCLVLAGAALAAAGEPDRPPPPGAPHAHRPPPEAVAACEGRPEGARVRFPGRGGEPVTGVCVRMGPVLAARPEPAPPPPDLRDRPPPPR